MPDAENSPEIANETDLILWTHYDAARAYRAVLACILDTRALIERDGPEATIQESRYLERLVRVTCEGSAWMFAHLR